MARPDLERGLQSFVAVRWRQPYVDNGHIRWVVPHTQQQLVRVLAGLYVKIGSTQQTHNSLPQQHAVLGDHGAHGTSALRRVPPPLGLQIRSWPSSASIRSARPRSPLPRSVSAPPTPSSVTSMTTWPAARVTSTIADEACAYLPMFARLSHTM